MVTSPKIHLCYNLFLYKASLQHKEEPHTSNALQSRVSAALASFPLLVWTKLYIFFIYIYYIRLTSVFSKQIFTCFNFPFVSLPFRVWPDQRRAAEGGGGLIEGKNVTIVLFRYVCLRQIEREGERSERVIRSYYMCFINNTMVLTGSSLSLSVCLSATLVSLLCSFRCLAWYWWIMHTHAHTHTCLNLCFLIMRMKRSRDSHVAWP